MQSLDRPELDIKLEDFVQVAHAGRVNFEFQHAAIVEGSSRPRRPSPPGPTSRGAEPTTRPTKKEAADRPARPPGSPSAGCKDGPGARGQPQHLGPGRTAGA